MIYLRPEGNFLATLYIIGLWHSKALDDSNVIDALAATDRDVYEDIRDIVTPMFIGKEKTAFLDLLNIVDMIKETA